jgi:polyferredoxin
MVTMDRARLARETLRGELFRQDDQRATRRHLGYVAVAALLWVAGTATAYASWAVTGEDLGNVLLWGGLSLGNVGVFLVWIAWLVSGTNRGEL